MVASPLQNEPPERWGPGRVRLASEASGRQTPGLLCGQQLAPRLRQREHRLTHVAVGFEVTFEEVLGDVWFLSLPAVFLEVGQLEMSVAVPQPTVRLHTSLSS